MDKAMPVEAHSALVFWEKPGCQGNREQLRWLQHQGVEAIVENLLEENWTARQLRPFFTGLPVADWFNASAPAVRAGKTDLATVDEDVALLMMVNDPLLIRRPLLQFGELKQAGFVDGPVLEALGIQLDPERDLQACPRSDTAEPCEVPA